MVADTDRDKYCVRQIIDFYKRQRTDYADYFLAAWRFQHREALGRPEASLADFAAEAGISPKYLATIWSFLTEPAEEVGPIAALQSLWRELPPPGDDGANAARAGCERMRDFVVELRQQLTPEVKNLTAPRHSTTARSRSCSGRTASMWPTGGVTCRRHGAAVPRRVDQPARRPPAPWPCPPSTDDAGTVRAGLRPLLLDVSRCVPRLGAGPRLPRPEEGEGEHGAAAERRLS